MVNIAQIDKNFNIETTVDKKDIKFYDVRQDPFKLYGVFYENGKFRRLPEEVAKSVSNGVLALHANTAGGRIRIKTDSPYLSIHVKMSAIGRMGHFALSGSAGFDLYLNDTENGNGQRHIKTFIPPYKMEDGFEEVAELGVAKMRELTLNFPLYSQVSELYIGLSETAIVCEPEPYRIGKPIVYYGSSITQGGCASRPGNSYQSVVSRRIDANYINLGFSGNAKGEDEITKYINGLDMSAFVLDYDHNSPTCETLQDTHEKMFKAIRDTHPILPIVIMERPKHTLIPSELKRCDIIRATYENAIANGDKNVYYLDHKKLTELSGDDGNVDYNHPNDFGFASMAKAVGDVLEKIL